MNVRAFRSFVIAGAIATAVAAATAPGSRVGATGSPDAATNAPGADAAHPLHLYISLSPTSLNPLLSTNAVDTDVALLIFDTLVAPDANNKLQPHLARVVPTRANGGISADGKTVTFKLRDGLRWQDGTPLTSADVAFTFAKINDPKVDVNSRTGYDRITRVATPDAHTVVVSLREPFSPFVAYVGYQYPIVPKHLLDKSANINHDPFGTHPVGAGPYRFERWDRGNRVELSANDAYYGGAPKIRDVIISEIPDQNTAALAFRSHEIDFGYVDSATFSQLRGAPGLTTTTEPNNDVVGYALNVTRPILADVRVRRAISMAIDRASITRKTTLGTGTVAYADLPAPLWIAREPANPYAYDPAAANALLDAAGWKRGPDGMRAKNGVSLSLRGIGFSGSAAMASMNVQVEQLLRDIGIDFTSKQYSVSLYFESKQNGGPLAIGDYDMASLSWEGGIDPENDVLFTCASREPQGNNIARYCSPEMDALQDDSLRTLDPARRAADIVKIERLAVTDVPYVFLYHTPWRIAQNPSLSRVHSSITETWNDVAAWSFAPTP